MSIAFKTIVKKIYLNTLKDICLLYSLMIEKISLMGSCLILPPFNFTIYTIYQLQLLESAINMKNCSFDKLLTDKIIDMKICLFDKIH